MIPKNLIWFLGGASVIADRLLVLAIWHETSIESISDWFSELNHCSASWIFGIGHFISITFISIYLYRKRLPLIMTLVIVSFIMTLSFNYMNCQHEYYRTIYPVIYPTLRYSQIGVDLMMFLLLLIQSYKKDIALTVFSVLGIVLYGIRAMFYLDLVRLEETPYLIWDILITGLPLFWSIMFFREIKRNQATDILDN